MSDSIMCPKCKRTSHNPGDIEHRYCVACGYHDEPLAGSRDLVVDIEVELPVAFETFEISFEAKGGKPVCQVIGEYETGIVQEVLEYLPGERLAFRVIDGDLGEYVAVFNWTDTPEIDEAARALVRRIEAKS